MYHVGARAYDPRTARWLQRDPIDAASGGPNLYRYCGNDPLNHADPSGLGPDAGTLLDIGIGFIPVVGALWDIGKGIAEGDWVRVGVGAVSLVVDVATLGSSRTVVGAARAGMVGARLVRGAVDCRALITVAKGTARAVIHLPNLRFASKEKLLDHFARHGREVGATSAEDYLMRARSFIGREGIEAHIRGNGDILFFDPRTGEFAVVANDCSTVRTYFNPGYNPRRGAVDVAKARRYWQRQLDKDKR